jgi:putative transposase
VGRLFAPERPDQTWVGDITWVPTDEGWLYLASVLDLAARRLVGWSMGEHHDASLVTDALRAAVATRGRARMGLRRSMGRTGSCLDNAVAESFLATLKVELVDRQHYRTRSQARASIFGWIAWYNRRRLHSTNGYLSPIQWEQRHATQPEASTLAA